MQCCTGNGTRALYYVWENILQHDDGRIQINLLLNRASAWADIDSHIPYTGQVDIRIKEPVEIAIRIPDWVTPAQTHVQVNERDRAVEWMGRYAQIDNLKPSDVVTLTFPLDERTEDVYIERERFTLVRRGNEIVWIDPVGRYHPLFLRSHYREDATRWRRTERFVAGKQVYF